MIRYSLHLTRGVFDIKTNGWECREAYIKLPKVDHNAAKHKAARIAFPDVPFEDLDIQITSVEEI